MSSGTGTFIQPWPPGGCRQCRNPSGTRTCRRNPRSGHCRDELYKNRSPRKIHSRRLFSREYDFPKTFSLTENQFSGKTYFYTIASRRLQGHYRRCRRSNRNCRPKPRFLKGLFTILFKGVLKNCRKNCPRPKPPRRRRPSKPRKCIICRDRTGGRTCGPTNLLLGCRGMKPERTRWCRREMNACFMYQRQYRECIGRNRNCNG